MAMNRPKRQPRLRVALIPLLLVIAGCDSSDGAPPTGASIETAGNAALDSVGQPTTPGTEAAQPDTSESSAEADAFMVIQVAANGRTELRLIDQDGNEVGSPGSDVPGGNQTNPDWSPDGQMLTFGMVGDDGRDDLWLVDVDGGDPHLLYDCVDECLYIDDPAWSRDGSSIAVCIMRSLDDADLGRLALVDVASGELTDLATFDDTQFCSGPRWSPDGSQIVLEVVQRADSTLSAAVTGVMLSIVDVANGAIVQDLTDPALFAATADWNRVTGEIVYSALSDASATDPALFVIQPEGSAPQRLTSLPDGDVVAVEPSVDPDGASIIFVSSGSVVSGLATINEGTGIVQQAFATPVRANHPRHRPAAAS